MNNRNTWCHALFDRLHLLSLKSAEADREVGGGATLVRDDVDACVSLTYSPITFSYQKCAVVESDAT